MLASLDFVILQHSKLVSTECDLMMGTMFGIGTMDENENQTVSIVVIVA